MEKLFVVVRNDLAPQHQMVQTNHASLEFAALFPDLFREWRDHARNIVLLQVPDEAALVALLDRAHTGEVPAAPFHEPDLGHSLTAIALGGAARRIVSELPKAMRPPKAA